MFLSGAASAQFLSREQILQALMPTYVTRSLTLANQTKPTVDLHEIYFEFNSAGITKEAEPQLRELGAALIDPRIKGSSISIGGHTDAVGGDAFNQILSERRAATIRWYLIDNFGLSPASLHAVGYGKRRPKNRADVYAPENRRVEIVNEGQQTRSQR
jgi:outer membrane protein OmpA-like peptidoglycan-associated protein